MILIYFCVLWQNMYFGQYLFFCNFEKTYPNFSLNVVFQNVLSNKIHKKQLTMQDKQVFMYNYFYYQYTNPFSNHN